jgi:hypothetical protein
MRAPVEGHLSCAVDAVVGVESAAPGRGPLRTGTLSRRRAVEPVSVVGTSSHWGCAQAGLVGCGAIGLVDRNLGLVRAIAEFLVLTLPIAQG